MPTRIMKDLFTGEIKFIDENDIPGRFGISFNRLRELVECNPDEGWVKWKVDRYTGKNNSRLMANAGDELACHTYVNGIQITKAQIVWVFANNGLWNKDFLDHKNGDQTNNRISNLREADRYQNGVNRKLHSNNTSGITGISWHDLNKMWKAQISIKGKVVAYYFKTKNEAIKKRQELEDEHYGEFAARHSRPRIPMKDLFA